MKKFLLSFLLLMLFACSKEDTTAEKAAQADQTLDKETVFSFSSDNLTAGCSSSSEVVCTISLAVKCIIDPNFAECEKNKNILPDFIFMQDETLQRPTFQSYQITKMKPRDDGAVEVYTQSSCNGSWFGLCNGNIIYVMKNYDSKWHIIDMYAVEF